MEKSVKLMIIVCSAIVVAAISSLAMVLPSKQNQEETYSIHPQKKEFWLFSSAIPEFNETKMGMPHDVFSQSAITVNKGDNVIIHFFNTEPAGGDAHSFTIHGKPYDTNVVVKPGENETVSFNATKTGVFPYECTFHQPTMRGQLIILTSAEP